MIDPMFAMIGGTAGLAGLAGFKLLTHKPKNDRGWMTLKQAKQYGLVGNERTGVIIGDLNGITLSDKSSNHFFINGPTGGGKTMTLIKTLLLNNRYSMIVSDQSGDLWRLTSGIRAQYGPVYRLDPSEPYTSLWNPFDELLFSKNLYSELSNLFRSLIVTKEQKQSKSDPHWVNKPIELAPIYALQLLLGKDPTKKNMTSVLAFMRSGAEAIQVMYDYPNHPKCREVAQSLLYDAKKGGSNYFSSIVSVLSNPLSVWDDINVQHMTNASSFRVDELATSEKGPVTIYMTAPARDIDRLLPLYGLVRDMVTSHLLYRRSVTLRGDTKKLPVLSVIDECQNELPEKLDKTMEICRKFGLRILAGWQSLDAAENHYGKHFLGLAKSHLTYRPTVGDNVCKRLSAMSGWYEKEITNKTESKDKLIWRISSRNTKKEWKNRLEPWDFERWPRFGVGMFTHDAEPALVRLTDAEADPRYQKYILPEYDMHKPEPIVSPWQDSIPTLVTPPASVVNELPFRDEHSTGDEDDEVIV